MTPPMTPPTIQTTAELVAYLREQLDGDDPIYTKHVVGHRSRELAYAIGAAATRLEHLERALTPDGDTKAAYHGEFKVDVPLEGYDEDGEPLEGVKSIYVPWTTIKEIMAAIKAHSLNQETSK